MGNNIGLLDIDGHNFPNLALMKISSWHKQQGDKVEFATMFGHYDILYKSKVFSWSVDPEYCYKSDLVVSGGTGYNYRITLNKDIEKIIPDYSLYECKRGYAFLTRGCPNNCNWCIVPRKEGNIKPDMDIENLFNSTGYESWILMDNNILASDYGIEQIKKISRLGIKVDFNQGLDARLIDGRISKLLSRIKWLNPVRIACDSKYMIEPVRDAVNYMRQAGVTPKNYFCWVLVKDIQDALERVEFLRSMNVDPFAQAYRSFDNSEPNQEQKDFCRWVNHKAIFKSVKYENYRARHGR